MTAPLSFVTLAGLELGYSIAYLGVLSADESKYYYLKTDNVSLYYVTITTSAVTSPTVVGTLPEACTEMILDPTDSGSILWVGASGLHRYTIATTTDSVILTSTAFDAIANPDSDWSHMIAVNGGVLAARGTKVMLVTKQQHGSFWELDVSGSVTMRKVVIIGGYGTGMSPGPDAVNDIVVVLTNGPYASFKFNEPTGQIQVFSGGGVFAGAGVQNGDAITTAVHAGIRVQPGFNVRRVPAGDIFYITDDWGVRIITGGNMTTGTSNLYRPLMLYSSGTRAIVNEGTGVYIFR